MQQPQAKNEREGIASCGDAGLFEPFVRRCLHLYWRWSRGLTLGVRAVVLDAEKRIFLVKHSYTSGWHLPGGGVEPNETMRQALGRELLEEGEIEICGDPVFHGIYFNRRISRRDHVGVFVVREFRQLRQPQPNAEIVAHGFFSAGGLPEDTTAATRARIAEVLEDLPPPQHW
jgi:ADP-ribose pyrophosphatase YjhB (NUDIX family)